MREMDSAEPTFSLKSAFKTLILPYIVFGGMSIMATRIIVNNCGVVGEEWRVICASIALILFSLFFIVPFVASAHVKRKLNAQKKVE